LGVIDLAHVMTTPGQEEQLHVENHKESDIAYGGHDIEQVGAGLNKLEGTLDVMMY